tara:strand:- start:212 stop:508 length:297 start_codon:yes stop_codon:yes gene_type:complete
MEVLTGSAKSILNFNARLQVKAKVEVGDLVLVPVGPKHRLKLALVIGMPSHEYNGWAEVNWHNSSCGSTWNEYVPLNKVTLVSNAGPKMLKAIDNETR